MAYDVFISYPYQSEDDDRVQDFYDSLVAFHAEYGTSKLKIFINRRNILNSERVNKVGVQEIIANSQVFIPLLSPEYFQDQRCRDEFLFFLDQLKQPATEEYCRILPVEMKPIQGKQSVPNAQRAVTRIQKFCDQSNCASHFLWEVDKKYKLVADFYKTLVKGIDQVLGNLPEPDVKNNSYEQSVFLAMSSSGASQKERKDLLAQLLRLQNQNQFPFLILPDQGLFKLDNLKTKSREEVENILNDQMRESMFSIHFFDDEDGLRAADSDVLITHLQYQIAREYSQSKEKNDFKVLVRSLVTEGASGLQREFMRSIEQDREFDGLEMQPQGTSLTAFKARLLEIVAEQEQRNNQIKPDELTDQGVFVVHHPDDSQILLLEEIQELIYNRNYFVFPSVFAEGAQRREEPETFEKSWAICSRAVLLLSQGSTMWCISKLIDLRHLAQQVLKRPSAIAICVSDPEANKRIEEMKRSRIEIINCTEQGFEQKIVQFLKKPLRQYAS
ncbi:MAG: TIR domain-containing protein [Saprospiraceae bacterium]|nr:TIR domain-containing protein [Saprospiraceae bacterium]